MSFRFTEKNVKIVQSSCATHTLFPLLLASHISVVSLSQLLNQYGHSVDL